MHVVKTGENNKSNTQSNRIIKVKSDVVLKSFHQNQTIIFHFCEQKIYSLCKHAFIFENLIEKLSTNRSATKQFEKKKTIFSNSFNEDVHTYQLFYTKCLCVHNPKKIELKKKYSTAIHKNLAQQIIINWSTDKTSTQSYLGKLNEKQLS